MLHEVFLLTLERGFGEPTRERDKRPNFFGGFFFGFDTTVVVLHHWDGLTERPSCEDKFTLLLAKGDTLLNMVHSLPVKRPEPTMRRSDHLCDDAVQRWAHGQDP